VASGTSHYFRGLLLDLAARARKTPTKQENMTMLQWTRRSLTLGAGTLLGTALTARPVTAAETFKFGITTTLTGIAASQGEAATKAVNLAVKQLNDGHYLKDVVLQPLFFDTQAKPDIGVAALQQAITVAGVRFVLTGYSSVSIAQAPIAERNEVVLMNQGGASPSLSHLSPWFFNAIPLTHLQVPVLLEEVIEVMKKPKLAMIYRDDDLGKGLLQIYGPTATALGGTLVGQESYLPGANDFRRQLARLRADQPDMVYIGGVATEIGAVIGQGASLGFRPLWTSYGAYNHKATIELGKDAAEGGIYTNPANIGPDLKPLPAYQAMLDAWKAAYGSTDDVDYVAGQYYLGAMLLADTLKALQDKGAPLESRNIRDTMRTMHYKTVTGDLYFNKDQDAITNIALYRLEKGEFRPFKVYTPAQVTAIMERVAKK
jgi:branched-chain amino acid transport system substrate-binding protein